MSNVTVTVCNKILTKMVSPFSLVFCFAVGSAEIYAGERAMSTRQVPITPIRAFGHIHMKRGE